MPANQPALDGALSKHGHGSRACYTAGCKAPQCVAANRDYQRDYRARLNGTLQAGRLAGTHRSRGPYRREP